MKPRHASKLHVLFCDDTIERHNLFRDVVDGLLADFARARAHSAEAGLSEAQIDFECHYSFSLRKQSRSVGKSVEELAKENLFDVVVTDLDFGPAGATDGLNIIEYLDDPERRPPWGTKFLLITSYGERVSEKKIRDRLFALMRRGVLQAADWIEGALAEGALKERVRAYLDEANRARQLHETNIDRAPILYDVELDYARDLTDGVTALRIREIGSESISLTVRVDNLVPGFTLWALAIDAGRFLGYRQLGDRVGALYKEARGGGYEKLPSTDRRTLLQRFGIDLNKQNELCVIEDERLCDVAKGNTVPAGKVGFQCQSKLSTLPSPCVKTFRFPYVEHTEFSMIAIQKHVQSLRDSVSARRIKLVKTVASLDRAGSEHEGRHLVGELCGHCLFYRRLGKSKKYAGWALAARVRNPMTIEEVMRRMKGSRT